MSQDRKITPTSRELTNSKSPHAPVPDHHHPISPYEHLLRGVSGVDLYRGHIPLPFDPAAIPRGIQLEAGTVAGGTVCYFPCYAPKAGGLWSFTSASFSLPAAAYYLPRHLAPSPTYPHLYPPYLIRGYPDTAAMENRQTIINDYITSQQMHHNAAATAMAQRADMLRGLSPREPSLALNYAAGPAQHCPGVWEQYGRRRLGQAGSASSSMAKLQQLSVVLTVLSLLSPGIIDLSQVPHLPVLVPPTPGTSATTMDRITYIPGPPQTFGSRHSSSPLSPGNAAGCFSNGKMVERDARNQSKAMGSACQGRWGDPKLILTQEPVHWLPLFLLVEGFLAFPPSSPKQTALWKVIPWRRRRDSYSMICLGFVALVALVCPAPGDLGWSHSLSALQTQRCEEQAAFPRGIAVSAALSLPFSLGFRRAHAHDQTVRIIGVRTGTGAGTRKGA